MNRTNTGSPRRCEADLRGIDLHIHTNFSPDSATTMERAVRAAHARDIDVIGFADHAEFVNEDEAYIVDNYNVEGIKTEIARLRKAFEGKLQILNGVEVGYIPGMEEEIGAFLDKHPFDYAIGSVHYVQGKLVSRWVREKELSGADFMPYFEAVLGAARSGLFCVLGHLDYVRKYMFAPQKFDREKYRGIVGQILEAAAEKELTLEINTSGWRHATEEPYPGDEILRKFAALGGRMTVGSDAHKYQEVGYGNERARGLLRDAGFSSINIFRGKQTEKIDL